MLTAINAKLPPYSINSSKTSADNKAAVQAALDTGKPVFLDRISLNIDVGLQMRSFGQALFGLGRHQTILNVKGDGNFVDVDGQHDCSFFDFTTRGYGDHTGGAIFAATGNAAQAGSGAQVWGPHIRNIVMDQCWDGIVVEDVNSLLAENVSMRNMLGWTGIAAYSMAPDLRTDVIRINNCQYSVHVNALAAGRGFGLVVDGRVQTITIDDYNIVRPLVGVDIRNSQGLPFGEHAAFLETSRIKIDYPKLNGIQIASVNSALFHQIYCQGSLTETGVVLGSGTRFASFSEGGITGHAKAAIYSDADDTVVALLNLGENALVGHVHPSVMFGPNASTARLIGNVAKTGPQTFGVTRMHGGTAIQIEACDQMIGAGGVKNW